MNNHIGLCNTNNLTTGQLHTPPALLLPMNSSSRPSTFFLRPRLLLMMGRSASSEPLALCPEGGACCSKSIWALREGLVTRALGNPANEGEALW